MYLDESSPCPRVSLCYIHPDEYIWKARASGQHVHTCLISRCILWGIWDSEQASSALWSSLLGDKVDRGYNIYGVTSSRCSEIVGPNIAFFKHYFIPFVFCVFAYVSMWWCLCICLYRYVCVCVYTCGCRYACAHVSVTQGSTLSIRAFPAVTFGLSLNLELF